MSRVQTRDTEVCRLIALLTELSDKFPLKKEKSVFHKNLLLPY